MLHNDLKDELICRQFIISDIRWCMPINSLIKLKLINLIKIK